MMNRSKRPSVFLVLSPYLYLLAVYFGIYIPFIVPNLAFWTSIPLYVVAPLALAYAFLLAVLGNHITYVTRIPHAIALAAFLAVVPVIGEHFTAPGFLKASETVLDLMVVEAFLVHLFVSYALLSFGSVVRVVNARMGRGPISTT